MVKNSVSVGESKSDKDLGSLSLPAAVHGLEESSAARAGSWSAATGFALARLAAMSEADGRPVLIAASPYWMRERGRPFGAGLSRFGLPHDRWLLASPDKEAALLWAAEEALRSGAVSGVLAALEAPSLVATRRLDLAARQGQSLGVALRVRPPDDLSAARVRWRVGTAPSALNPLDPAAPGAVRWRVEAVKRRDGPPGEWLVEWDDETGRLRMAAGLADHAPVRGHAHAAA